MTDNESTHHRRPYRPPRLHQVKTLRTYLANSGLEAAAGSSSMGRLLDRASIMSVGYRLCPRCHGETTVTDGVERKGKPGPNWMGKLLLEHLGVSHEELVGLCEALMEPRTCPRCKGLGRVPDHIPASQVTAWPTKSSKRGGPAGHCLDDSGVEMLGRVARWLSEVGGGLSGPLCVTVLEDYYGPVGRSLTAVGHLTPAGKTLLKRAPERERDAPRAYYERMQRESRAGFTDRERDALLSSMDQQARDLLDLAIRAWNAVVPDEYAADEEQFWDNCGAPVHTYYEEPSAREGLGEYDGCWDDGDGQCLRRAAMDFELPPGKEVDFG